MNIDDQKEVGFFPFHAINEFMTDEFRADVVHLVLTRLPELEDDVRSQIERQSKKMVAVPGFRNSQKAPPALRIKPTIDAFQKNPLLLAAILDGWAELHAELRQQVYDLLISRGWELLPINTDRKKLPGFIMQWYKGEDFDTLFQAYQAANPGCIAAQNDVSLMVVWLSGRLPYEFIDMPNRENHPSEDISQG
jgi:hypothetical protein